MKVITFSIVFVLMNSVGCQWDTLDALQEQLLSFLSPARRNLMRNIGATAGVNWSHCGTRNDSIVIRKMDLKPNPIMIPGSIEAQIEVEVRERQDSPIMVQIQMQKLLSLFGARSWVPVPCYGNGMGSCTVKDICRLPILDGSLTCPGPGGKAIPCSCPVSKGTYKFPPVVYQIPRLPRNIPSSLANGLYRVRLYLSRNRKLLTCLEATLNVAI